ncbi:hypothetical protein JCM3774_001090 [Rhodotorula dairenensis]
MPTVISDTLLSTLANTFGTLAVVGIVAYQFLEINAKRLREQRDAELSATVVEGGSTPRDAEKTVRAVQ